MKVDRVLTPGPAAAWIMVWSWILYPTKVEASLIDVDKISTKDEIPTKLTEEDIKKINDADDEIKLIEKRLEIAKAEKEIIEGKAKAEIDIIEAKIKDRESKAKDRAETVKQVLELTKIGYTKKEINKLLGL